MWQYFQLQKKAKLQYSADCATLWKIRTRMPVWEQKGQFTSAPLVDAAKRGGNFPHSTTITILKSRKRMSLMASANTRYLEHGNSSLKLRNVTFGSTLHVQSRVQCSAWRYTLGSWAVSCCVCNSELSSFIMSTLSKMLDLSSFASVDRLLQHAQTDDLAFLILAIFSGIFYNVYIRDKPDPYYHLWFEKPQKTDANQKGPETRDIAVKLEESVSLHFHALLRKLTFLN